MFSGSGAPVEPTGNGFPVQNFTDFDTAGDGGESFDDAICDERSMQTLKVLGLTINKSSLNHMLLSQARATVVTE